MDRKIPKIKRSAYRKPEAVKELERLANEAAMFKHPTCPHLAPRKFRDDTANGLTQCIVQYIVLCGGFATRINNQGTWSKKQNRFIPGTSRRGLADVMATYNGLSLHIEVKIGKDRQSQAQKYYQAAIERAGGCTELFAVLMSSLSNTTNWLSKIESYCFITVEDKLFICRWLMVFSLSQKR
jgi:hypothetical protein